MDLGALTLADFEPLVGDAFAITPPAGGAPPPALTLASAATLGARPGGRDPFALTFHGPPEPVLAQAIVCLEHAALGVLEIFVVPLGRGDGHTIYEAIFT
ncbi:MAG: DUF6916 family protein [Solirubrobacteraceae bacterium]